MKRILLFLLPVFFLLVVAFHYAQTTLPVVSLKAEKMNVFYKGLANPVYVEAEDVAPEDISVTVSGGDATIERGGSPGHFIVKVNTGWEVMLNLGQRVDTTIRNLGSYQFRVKRVPDPVLYVYNHKLDDTIPAEDLQKQLGVFARMENFDFDCSFAVKSFWMSIYHDSTWHDMKATGPVFSLGMKQQMKLLEHGDRVLLHDVNIKMESPPGDTALRKIPGVYFVIK